MGLVADQQLGFERAKFSIRVVARDAAGGLAHLRIRKIDGGRFELRDSLCLEAQPAPAPGRFRFRAERIGERIPFVALGVAFKIAGRKVFERAGAVPRPLIVGEKHVAGAIGADAPGRAQSTARGNRCAIRRNPQAPAAVFTVGGK